MASRDPIPDHLIPKVPESFAPKGYRANLDELARQISEDKSKDTDGPLKGVAEAIANLKFHELMEMANAIGNATFGPPKDTGETNPNYDLASSLSAWALAHLK
jgi:hypothetical protein